MPCRRIGGAGSQHRLQDVCSHRRVGSPVLRTEHPLASAFTANPVGGVVVAIYTDRISREQWEGGSGSGCTGREGVEEGECGVGAGAERGGLLGRVPGEEGVPEAVELLRGLRRPLQRRPVPFPLRRWLGLRRAGARARAGRRRLLGGHGIYLLLWTARTAGEGCHLKKAPTLDYVFERLLPTTTRLQGIRKRSCLRVCH